MQNTDNMEEDIFEQFYDSCENITIPGRDDRRDDGLDLTEEVRESLAMVTEDLVLERIIEKRERERKQWGMRRRLRAGWSKKHARRFRPEMVHDIMEMRERQGEGVYGLLTEHDVRFLAGMWARQYEREDLGSVFGFHPNYVGQILTGYVHNIPESMCKLLGVETEPRRRRLVAGGELDNFMARMEAAAPGEGDYEREWFDEE